MELVVDGHGADLDVEVRGAELDAKTIGVEVLSHKHQLSAQIEDLSAI
jgi:hypothetical protein